MSDTKRMHYYMRDDIRRGFRFIGIPMNYEWAGLLAVMIHTLIYGTFTVMIIGGIYHLVM